MIKNWASIFTPRDRIVFGLLVLVITGAGFLDVFGIGLLYPYISILQDQNKIFSIKYMNYLYKLSGLQTTHAFLYLVSGGLIVVFCSKSMLGLLVNKFQSSFVFGKQSELSRTLLSYYLTRPYSFFLSTNTSAIIVDLTTSVTHVCSGALQAGLLLLSELVVLAGLLVVLLIVSPGVFLAVATLVGGVSIIIFKLVRARVVRDGEISNEAWKNMAKTANEAGSAVKEIQVLGRARFFIELFDRDANILAKAMGRNAIVASLPRVVLETAAVVSLVSICVVAISLGQVGERLFALLAVFAVATIRMVPSANRILQAWNGLSFYAPAINIVAAALKEVRNAPPATLEKTGPELRLRKAISIQIKEFAYEGNPHFRLRNIDLKIPCGQSVAFIGPSGSGKSTLIDLILGIHTNYKGAIHVDERDIRENIMDWRRNIGYIPQSLYIRDDTIVRNVAFGLSDEQIDLEQVRRAVNLAGLKEVIDSQALGLETIVGDRGIRLSGGERQRIGIARALYHDPDLLILDEATSALDNATERQIVESILNTALAKTIIIIAHRLGTVQRCDAVYLLAKGEIIDRGSFADVRGGHPEFLEYDGAARDR